MTVITREDGRETCKFTTRRTIYDHGKDGLFVNWQGSRHRMEGTLKTGPVLYVDIKTVPATRDIQALLSGRM